MDRAQAGFTWTIEAIKDGVVIDREVQHNLIPIEGINYLINAGIKGATQSTSWYIAPFSGSYTPVSTDTAATFPASATEFTGYVETARQTLVLGTTSAGQVDNTASLATFTSPNTVTGATVAGGFITSSPTKGATSGTLISAVRFSSPKPFDQGTVLKITAGFSISST